MSQTSRLRVLFCIAINQNFFDAPVTEQQQVWAAFGQMWNGIARLPGMEILGNLDDDQSRVGASQGWPWTTYLLADAPDLAAVHAACNLFRSTPVGDGTYKLWRYCQVEARTGRELIIQA